MFYYTLNKLTVSEIWQTPAGGYEPWLQILLLGTSSILNLAFAIYFGFYCAIPEPKSV